MADDDDQTNEILAAARDAKARIERAKDGRDKGGVPLTAIGIGLGIGSAALAAAVLYSNRDRRKRDN